MPKDKKNKDDKKPKNKSISKQERKGGELLARDPNGNNILMRFKKVYGDEAGLKFEESLKNFQAAGGQVKQDYSFGKYGHNLQLTTKDGKVLKGTDDIVKELSNHAPASTRMTDKYVGSDPENASNPFVGAAIIQKTRDALKATEKGGLESSLARRFGRAFAGGDTNKGREILAGAIATYERNHAGGIRVIGKLGETGTYIEVLDKDGNWTSNSDIVSRKLSSGVNLAPTDESEPVFKDFKNHGRFERLALLGDANGQAIMNRLNLALNTEGEQGLKDAVRKFEESSPGNDIKVHGKIGEPGFWIEVKTADGGWTSDTGKVLKRIQGSTALADEKGNKPYNGPAGRTIDDPKKDKDRPKNGVGVNSRRDDNDQRNAVPGAGNNGNKRYNGPAGRTIDDPNKRPEQAAADINIGAAAQKSQALMAADRDGSGAVSQQEINRLRVADTNNNGTLSQKEITGFVNVADTNQSGVVSGAEAKAFRMVDANDNGKISNREIRAYNAIDTNNDGEISKKEAKQALKAQIDSKQDRVERNLAQEYLNKAGGKNGGGNQVSEQAAALVSSETAKRKNNDNDGPGGKKKKKNRG